jgi:hypothetical protein
VFLALGQALEGGLQIDFVVFANLLESFVELIGARLAASDMKGGEKGSPCSRILFEKRFHGKVGGHLGWHVGKMTENPFGERGELRLSKAEEL